MRSPLTSGCWMSKPQRPLTKQADVSGECISYMLQQHMMAAERLICKLSCMGLLFHFAQLHVALRAWQYITYTGMYVYIYQERGIYIYIYIYTYVCIYMYSYVYGVCIYMQREEYMHTYMYRALTKTVIQTPALPCKSNTQAAGNPYLVLSESGTLMLTTSHCFKNSSRSLTSVTPSLSMSGLLWRPKYSLFTSQPCASNSISQITTRLTKLIQINHIVQNPSPITYKQQDYRTAQMIRDHMLL